MARVDLHAHSTHSDGVRSPEYVVHQAAAHGVEFFALTDHDTFAGVAAAQVEGQRLGVAVVAGVEISAVDPDLGELHVLGYVGDEASVQDLEDQLAAYQGERLLRARRTVERLGELGLKIEYEAVSRIADGASIGRPHIARALVEAGLVESVQDAFDRYLRNDGPAYIPRALPGLSRSIAMIHDAGGFASLAHPTRYNDPQAAIAAFHSAGGDGIEIYYRRDGPETVANGEQIARELGLIATVGSDFHGLHPDEQLPGTIPVPDAAAERIIGTLKEL